jgi:carbonic anhydrase
MGANWWGRKTPKFGASLVEGEIQSPVDLKTIDTMETSGTI